MRTIPGKVSLLQGRVHSYFGRINQSHDAILVDEFSRESFIDAAHEQFAADDVRAEVKSFSMGPDRFKVYITGDDQVGIQSSLRKIFAQLNIQGMVEVVKKPQSIRGEAYSTWLKNDQKMERAMNNFGRTQLSSESRAIEAYTPSATA